MKRLHINHTLILLGVVILMLISFGAVGAYAQSGSKEVCDNLQAEIKKYDSRKKGWKKSQEKLEKRILEVQDKLASPESKYNNTTIEIYIAECPDLMSHPHPAKGLVSCSMAILELQTYHKFLAKGPKETEFIKDKLEQLEFEKQTLISQAEKKGCPDVSKKDSTLAGGFYKIDLINMAREMGTFHVNRLGLKIIDKNNARLTLYFGDTDLDPMQMTAVKEDGVYVSRDDKELGKRYITVMVKSGEDMNDIYALLEHRPNFFDIENTVYVRPAGYNLDVKWDMGPFGVFEATAIPE